MEEQCEIRILIRFFSQEQRKLEKSLFGFENQISRNEYNEIYKTTGIDVDGRQEVVTKYLSYTQNSLQEFVDWCTQVPGFSNLSLNDQTKLMKGKNDQDGQMVIIQYTSLHIHTQIYIQKWDFSRFNCNSFFYLRQEHFSKCRGGGGGRLLV